MTSGSLLRCPNCSTQNPDAARFCMSCGGSLEIPCSECGTALPAAARFCFSCGHEIESGATAGDPGRTAQQVTDSIADQLREITSGAGERRTVTMLFCDVKDSTATAEGLDPEAWSDIMHEAMDCFVSSVERYGGTVARLLGDAILAYFGAPVAHEDDPQRALLAALAIRECTRPLCRRVRAEHTTDFDVRIGINTGLVVVGAMGSDTFAEYAALGDAANVAARMEQTAEPGTIRIAEPTHRLIAPLFDTEPVGTIEVKGRTEPVGAYTVVAARGQPGQVRGIEGLSAPLVGRAAELERLRDAVAAIRSGSGRIVALLGEAGLGKSRLAAELRGLVAEDEPRWITGQCHSYEDTTPYAPFVPALTECFGLDPTAPPAERGAALIDAVVELLGEDDRTRALYLCTMLGLPTAREDQALLSYLDPGTLRDRVFDAVATILRALASREPVVLELEDLHWADPTSIDLVEQLLLLTEEVPLLMLLLFRPRRDEPSWRIHETASRDHAHRYHPIVLGPLDDDGARELVGHLLRVEGLSPRVRETILTKSEGNPFFVEEVIRSLLDAGTIVRDDDRFVATKDIDDIAVPDTLAAVLATRLDRLDPAVRTVVQTAAVLGRQFSLEMLRPLVDPGLDLDRTITDLQRRELLVEERRDPEVVLSFKHTLTRDTAYNTLLRSVRRDLHRIVGKLVEERHPDRVFDLARHFAEADEPLKAVPYLVAAGEEAFGAFSREDAADLFRRAIDLWDDRQDVALARSAYEGLGNARMYLGQIPESIDAFEEMLAFAEEHGDVEGQISALNKGGFVTLIGTGDADRAEKQMLAAKALAEDEDAKMGIAEFHVGYCYLNVSQGRLDRAEEHLGEAAEVCFSLDAHHRNFGLLHYANTLVYQTRIDEARPAMARAREQAELDDDLEHLAEAINGQAMIDLFTGNPVAAASKSEEAYELATRIGSVLSIAEIAWVGGLGALARGDLDTARDYLQVAAEKGPAAGLTGQGAAALVGLGTVEQLVHGPEEPAVTEYFEQARQMYASPMAQATAAAIWSHMGLDLLMAGRLDEAEEALRTAAVTPSATSKVSEPEILLCRGGLAFSRGNTAEAVPLYNEAAALVERTGLDLYRPRVLLGQAIVASIEGSPDRMLDLLEEAEQDALDRLMRVDALIIQRMAADLLTGAGRTEAARFREHAGDTVAEIAARLADHDRRRDFLRTNTMVS